MPTPKEVTQLLREVQFPGIDRDIVSLGYVKDVREEGGRFRIRIEVRTSVHGAGEPIEREARAVLDRAGVPYDLEFIAHHPSGAAPLAAPQKETPLASIRWKIAVASGKGGVGKSTVAVNLALALAKRGRRVGLLDSDVYGPSIPLMFGQENEEPEVRGGKLQPMERYGVRNISIGYLVDRHTPVIWRGPMVGKALDQLMEDVAWGDTEVLVFDLPPGTGDVQISLAQKAHLSGALIVTTPQDVALMDAGKGVAMFQRVEVPVLGIIENMSSFACPHCGARTDIFGKDGGRREADRLGVPFLGEIPIDPEIVRGGDEGTPIVERAPGSEAARAFHALAARVLELLESLERG